MIRYVGMLCVVALAAGAAPSGPLVVTHGGIYRGSWSSDDAQTPVVRIATTEPVSFDHCTFTGRGDLIQSKIDHSDITLCNCTGVGENPNIVGQCAGRFLDDESFDRVRVEHCELGHTAGIYLRDCIATGNRAAIVIVANHAIDIDGRKSNGSGGYLDFDLRTNNQTHEVEAGFSEVQFLQLDGVHAIAGVDIGWNHVINEPGASRVEDNINLYNSSGTEGSPMSVHDNCIRGAYPINPAGSPRTDPIFSFDWSYSGGGILLGDGADKVAENRSAHIRAKRNTVIGTTNYAIAIAAGHDISFEQNVMVSSGLLRNGQVVAAQNVGAYIWNVYKPNHTTPATFAANGGRDNVIGWMKGDRRNDYWTPDAAFWTGNTAVTGRISLDSEDVAEKQWISRAAANGIEVGLKMQQH